MLLSKAQKSLLEMLRSFGALRGIQAEHLLGMDYPSAQIKPAIHQLICQSLVHQKNDCITAPNREPDMNILDAIDIMLLLEPDHVELFEKGVPPFVLTFFRQRQDKLWRYDICPVIPGKEMLISALVENINQKYRIIVFILETPEQQKMLIVPCEHCFTWMENGVYRFYKLKKE